MKKVSILLILTFILNLIGQIIWWKVIFSEQPLFGSKYLEEMTMFWVYTSSAIFGLLAGIVLYKSYK